MDTNELRHRIGQYAARQPSRRVLIRAAGMTLLALGAVAALWWLLWQSAAEAQGGSEWAFMNGPYTPGGTVTHLQFAPSRPDRVYAVVVDRGWSRYRLHRSDDGGEMWTAAYTYPMPVSALAIDPTAADVLYSGGEDRCLKSEDGGTSWTQVYTVGRYVAIDPLTPTTVYAGGIIEDIPGPYADLYGLAKSTDGGTTWSLSIVAAAGYLSAMAIHPVNSDLLYIGGLDVNRSRVLYQSKDGGVSWERLWPASPMYPLGTAVRVIVLNSHNPDVMYISDGEYLLRSTDGGVSWNELDGLPQSEYRIALDPHESDTVYAVLASGSLAGQYPVYKSLDGGDTWWLSGNSLSSPAGALSIHPSDTATLLVGLADDGVYKSHNGGSSWREINAGMLSLQSVTAVARGTFSATVFAASGYKQSEAYRTTNGGMTWIPIMTGTHVQAIATHSLTPTTLYAAGEDTLYLSMDQGAQWHSIMYDPNSNWLNIAFGPTDSEVLYAVGHRREPRVGLLKRRIDLGMWETVLFTSSLHLNTVAVHTYDPNVMYVGGMDNAKGGVLYRSQDGATTWTQVLTLAGEDITCMTVDPRHPATAYAGSDWHWGGVFKSVDAGNTWLQANGSLTANVDGPNVVYALAVDALGHVFRGTAAGIYRSDDGGETWTAMNDGLPGGRINALLVQTNGDRHYLLAGAERGGVYRYLIADLRHKAYLPLAAR